MGSGAGVDGAGVLADGAAGRAGCGSSAASASVPGSVFVVGAVSGMAADGVSGGAAPWLSDAVAGRAAGVS